MNVEDMTLKQREAVTSVLLRLNATLVDEALNAPEEDTGGMLRAAHTVSVEAGPYLRSLTGGDA